MKKKLNKVYWLFGLFVLCCIGGVFAYWTQELLAHNEFKTARYDTNIEEKFVSPDNWKPGQNINKDVWISNSGTVPTFTKIVLHQEWIRKENVTDLEGNIIPPKAGDEIPLFFQAKQGNSYAAQIEWGENVVLLASGKKSTIDLGISIVNCIDDAKGKWLLVSDEPDQNNDFLLYYIGIINPEGKTPFVVDSVTMNPLIQPAIISKDTSYDEAEGKWTTKTQINSTYDYECAKYTMLVTATTVQATADAVKDVYGTSTDNREIVNYLANHAINPADL